MTEISELERMWKTTNTPELPVTFETNVWHKISQKQHSSHIKRTNIMSCAIIFATLGIGIISVPHSQKQTDDWVNSGLELAPSTLLLGELP